MEGQTPDPEQPVEPNRAPLFAWFLAGATATGKTAVAQWLAETRGYAVLSAGSMLVYRGMDIGTAKPAEDERRRVAYYGIDLKPMEQLHDVDAIVVAVCHQTYRDMGLTRLAGLCNGGNSVVIDVKSAFDAGVAEKAGITYWRL